MARQHLLDPDDPVAGFLQASDLLFNLGLDLSGIRGSRAEHHLYLRIQEGNRIQEI